MRPLCLLPEREYMLDLPTPRQASYQGHAFQYRVLKSDHCDFPPVLMIGGAFQTMDSWGAPPGFLTQYTDVILVDLPGTGDSEPLSEDHTHDFLALAADSLLQDLGIDTFCAIGASYGSTVAYRLAQLTEHTLHRLVLVGVMARLPAEVRCRAERHLSLLMSGELDEFANEVAEGLVDETKGKVRRGRAIGRALRNQLRRLDTRKTDQYVANSRRLLLQESLDLADAPRVPALVCTGEFDIFTKPEYGREVAMAFEESYFTTLKEADHLCHVERFDALAEICWRFFSGQPVEGSAGCNAIEKVGRKHLPPTCQQDDTPEVNPGVTAG
jgi:pimeloyl-ACP methyl ester carboxylesterase